MTTPSPEPRRSFALGIFAAVRLALSAICAILALASLGGAAAASLDLLTHLAPAYLALSVLGLLFCIPAGPSRTPALVMNLVAVAASGLLVAPELRRPTAPANAASAPGAIKVIQFNVWRGNRGLGPIVDWLQREDPDFVLIEEASPELRDLILRRTGWGVAGSRTTSMIFSRAPYLVMHRPTAPERAGFTWVNATYASASGPLEVVVTHFDRMIQRDATRQERGLAQVLAALPRERMILAGDFNATPWSFMLRRADRDFGLVRRDRALATWPASSSIPAYMPIDHVYAGPGWKTLAVRRGPALGSDHYPIVVLLAPATAGPSGGPYPGSPAR